MRLAPTYPLSGCLTTIPGGTPGVWSTIRKMRSLVNAYKIEPAILETATQRIFLTPQYDSNAELEALFDLVRDEIRYTRDVHGVETLADPITTLNRRMGDCDDQATLAATLFEAVGYPTRFIVAGYSGNDFEHVYLQVLNADGQWINADPTQNQPFGWAPPNPTILDMEKV